MKQEWRHGAENEGKRMVERKVRLGKTKVVGRPWIDDCCSLTSYDE